MAPLLFSHRWLQRLLHFISPSGYSKPAFLAFFSTSAGFDQLKLRVDLARAGVTKSHRSVHASKRSKTWVLACLILFNLLSSY